MEEPREKQFQLGEQKQTLGFGAKLINIFTSPTKTFEALDNKPTWLVPLIMFIIITAIMTQIAFPLIMDAQLERIRSNHNIPAERLEAIEEQITGNLKMQRFSMLGGQIIVTPIIFFIVAGIFYLIGNIFLGGDATYKKILSIYSWSSCILIISALIMMPLVLIKGNLNVSLSPAMLLSGDALETKLYMFFSKFDFFVIWFLAVFATGFAVIYRFSKAVAFTAVGITWGIWIAVSVALSGVLKQFGLG